MNKKVLSLVKLFIQGILLCNLITLGIMFLYYFAALKQATEAGIQNALLFNLIFLVVFLVLPFLYFIFTFSLVRKTFQSRAIIPLIFKTKLKKLNTLVFSINILFNIALIFIVCSVVYEVFNDKPPQFFPLHSPKAHYTIKVQPHVDTLREQSVYFVSYESTEPHASDFCTNEYTKDGVTHCEYDAMIGKSPIDLDQYIGKEIIIDGSFEYGGKEQCIVKRCVDIGGPYVVFDIKSIRLK